MCEVPSSMNRIEEPGDESLIGEKYCPQCLEILVQVNDGSGKKDVYCEECGWPDENRKNSIEKGD